LDDQGNVANFVLGPDAPPAERNILGLIH